MKSMLEALDSWLSELRRKLQDSQKLNDECIQLLDDYKAVLGAQDASPETWVSLITRELGLVGKAQQLLVSTNELRIRNPALILAAKLGFLPNTGYGAGDHIVIDWGHGIQHHGIYLGNQLVIHNAKEAGRVCFARLEDFCGGRTPRVVQYSRSDPPETVIKRALSCFGGLYDLWNDNCEHFALWCKTGRHESEQAASGAPVVSACAAAVVGAVAALVGLWRSGVIGFSPIGILTGLEYIGSGSSFFGVVVILFAPAVATGIAGYVGWRNRRYEYVIYVSAGVGFVASALPLISPVAALIATLCGGVWMLVPMSDQRAGGTS